MYSAKTLAEAGRMWWNDNLADVSFICGYLGIPFEQNNKTWQECGHTPGYFTKHDSRDTIAFNPLTAEKIKRTMGVPVPVGEQKNELALINSVDNSDGKETIHASLHWEKEDSLTLESVSSETHGWSVCVTQGVELGTDTNKYIGSIALSASGEYSKSRAESKTTEIEGGGSLEVDVEAGKIARLIQTVRSGEVEIDVVDEVVLALGWKIADWKKRTNSMLNDHSGYSKKGRSKSRWHWNCESTDDFRTMIDGTNPRYPNVNAELLKGKCFFEIERLLKEENRTIIVKSKARFKRGIWGDAKVEIN